MRALRCRHGRTTAPARRAKERAIYRILIQEIDDDALTELGEQRSVRTRDPRVALAQLDRLTAMGFDAVAEQLEPEGWTWLPDDELAALADGD